jgi:Cdc6-like AAA superfamily ATPase
MDVERKTLLRRKLRDAFNPGAPISRVSLFAGRMSQLQTVVGAIGQPGQHAVLYGERGVGKTSLAAILSELFEEKFHDNKWLRYVRVNCDADDSFATIWRKVFRELTFVYEKKSIGFGQEIKDIPISLESLIKDDVRPEDVRYKLEKLGGLHIIVIDEFDRIQDPEASRLMADTIKALSDHRLEATIVIVGVADAVDELLGAHLSIERSVVQVHVPRMSHDELAEILEKALTEAEMTMVTESTERIISLSQGLPHYTHLLGLHAAQTALEADRDKVSISDVEAALARSVEEAQQSTKRRYQEATSSSRETLYPQVLLACALAHTDDLGYFAASDVREPLSRIMGKDYDIPAYSRHLYDFCEDSRGPVLTRIGFPRRYRFRFINPLMEPFVIMKALADGLLTQRDLKDLNP